jgi:clan AA aspartic protease (TIGR02281 family)
VSLKYEQHAGPVSTLGEYPDAKVLLDGQVVFEDKEAGSITISAAFPSWSNPSTLVLLMSTGGNACVGSYAVLDVPTRRMSEAFGTCGEATVRETADGLIFAFSKDTSDLGWVYKAGQLTRIPDLSVKEHVEQGVAAYKARNYSNAIEHLWVVRQSTFADAPLFLGLMAHLGHGVAQNYKVAMASYKQAAEIGSASALFRIGVLYANGRGVAKNDVEAVRWYRQAAELNDGLAQFNVGLAYLTGRGAPKDSQEAFFWILLAKERATDPKLTANIAKDLALLESNLTGPEKESVRQRVLSWTPRSTEPELDASNIRSWIGKYPSFDRIRGLQFFDTPEVQLQMKLALGAAALNEIKEMNTASPIREDSGWVVASGCTPHMCADGKWAVAINTTTLETWVCLTSLNSRIARYASSRGTKFNLSASPDDCPSSEHALERFRVVLAPTLPEQSLSSAASISMKMEGGTYVVPVEINGALTLDFVVDSGATDVSIPFDVVSTLMRAGTIGKSDIIGSATYSIADGSTISGVRFRIHSLKLGNVVVRDVIGSAIPTKSDLLLGQSFLRKFKGWSVDNAQHRLVLQQ